MLTTVVLCILIGIFLVHIFADVAKAAAIVLIELRGARGRGGTRALRQHAVPRRDGATGATNLDRQ